MTALPIAAPAAAPVTAIYLRISRDDVKPGEAVGLGVARQLKDCREFCARMGWPVFDVFEDNDFSASKRNRKARPEYDRLMGEVRAGRVTRIVVTYLDRLYRDNRELEDLVDLAQSTRVDLVPLTMGDINLRTADGRMMARVITGFNRGEAEKIAEKVRRKHLELAEAGKLHGGGRRPYGFEADRVTIRPAEAELIREAAQRMAAGESARSVAADWNGRGIPAAAGGRWSPNQLRQMITSPRMIGKRTHRGEIAADAVWDPILDEVTWKRIVRRYETNASAVDLSSRSRKYLLTGLVKCGICKGKLSARPRDTGQPTYICLKDKGGCGKLTVVVDPVDTWVRKIAFVALNDAGFIERLAALAGGTNDAAIAEALAEDEEALRELTNDYYVARPRRVSREHFLSASATLEARIAAAQRAQEAGLRLQALEGLIGKGDALVNLWDGLTLARKQAVLALLFSKLEIRPAIRGANRFSTDRIDWELAAPLTAPPGDE